MLEWDVRWVLGGGLSADEIGDVVKPIHRVIAYGVEVVGLLQTLIPLHWIVLILYLIQVLCLRIIYGLKYVWMIESSGNINRLLGD